MSDLSTRGERVEASGLYANAEEAAAICNWYCHAHDLTLCIDKEEWVGDFTENRCGDLTNTSVVCH